MLLLENKMSKTYRCLNIPYHKKNEPTVYYGNFDNI